MKYPTVAVNGVSVRVDADGRYCLNDLHAAAVARGEASESQRPSNFTKSKGIKEISQCAKRMNQWGVGGRKQLLKLARERMVADIQPLLPGLE